VWRCSFEEAIIEDDRFFYSAMVLIEGKPVKSDN